MQGMILNLAQPGGIAVSDVFTDLVRYRPDVFLSHKSEDREVTLAIAQALIRQNISVYIDYVDPQVDAKNPKLESYLRKIIHSSKSLLTIATANTINSWWVPFEIGVALDNDKLVGTVLRGTPGQLPTYLLNWPVMESNDEAVAQQWQQYLMLPPSASHQAWRQALNTFNLSSQR